MNRNELQDLLNQAASLASDRRKNVSQIAQIQSRISTAIDRSGDGPRPMSGPLSERREKFQDMYVSAVQQNPAKLTAMTDEILGLIQR